MDAIPTHSEIEAAEAAEYLRERADLWGEGFGVDPEAIVTCGRGRGPRPPQESWLLRKMVIFDARREGHSRAAIAAALGIHEKTVLRHENDAKSRYIETVQRLEFSVAGADDNIHEYKIDIEIKPEPNSMFFDDLRRSKEKLIKRAGPRQVRRRRAAAKTAASVADPA